MEVVDRCPAPVHGVGGPLAWCAPEGQAMARVGPIWGALGLLRGHLLSFWSSCGRWGDQRSIQGRPIRSPYAVTWGFKSVTVCVWLDLRLVSCQVGINLRWPWSIGVRIRDDLGPSGPSGPSAVDPGSMRGRIRPKSPKADQAAASGRVVRRPQAFAVS